MYIYNINMSKLVTVLTDNDQYKSDFFDRLGNNNDMNSKIFKYDTYNINVENHKLKTLMLLSDGIIIVINCKSLSNSVIDRITNIIREINDKPILIIIEKTVKFDIEFDPCKLFENITKVNYRRSFLIDYTERIVRLEFDIPKSWFNNQLLTFKPILPIISETIKQTSETIKTSELISHFENCSLPLNIWNHYTKLRLIHYSLRIYGFDKTVDQKGWLCTNWKNHEISIGRNYMWNYTMVRFWIYMIYLIQQKHRYKNFKELYNKNLNLHNGAHYKEYYSDDHIFSNNAKNNWVLPNLKNLN